MPHFSYQMPLGMISFGTQRGITVHEKKSGESSGRRKFLLSQARRMDEFKLSKNRYIVS